MSQEERELTEGAPPEQEAPLAPPPPVAERTAEGREAGAGAPSGERPRGDSERRRRPFGRRKVCSFCVEKVKEIDYKDAGRLRRFVSDRGRIESRRKTGTCAKHQRWLAVALKRARHLAMLPYTPEHVRNLGGPVGRR